VETKLPYGLKNDILVSIDEVDNGLRCECVCPSCKGQLMARKGNIKIHHFAHYKVPDCGQGLETALHIISKEFFKNRTHFVTPPLFYKNGKFEIFSEQRIPIDGISFEQKIGEIIPDIIIESKGKKLLVEIAVHHTVDYHKLQKIKSLNIATIEIYAKHLLEDRYHKRDFGLERSSRFPDELVTGTKFKRWIYNPKINHIKNNLRDNYAELKPINSFKVPDHIDYEDYFNYVDDCPIAVKIWQSGAKKGQPYAKSSDCESCVYCVSTQNVIGVHCVGYLKADLPKLIQNLK